MKQNWNIRSRFLICACALYGVKGGKKTIIVSNSWITFQEVSLLENRKWQCNLENLCAWSSDRYWASDDVNKLNTLPPLHYLYFAIFNASWGARDICSCQGRDSGEAVSCFLIGYDCKESFSTLTRTLGSHKECCMHHSGDQWVLLLDVVQHHWRSFGFDNCDRCNQEGRSLCYESSLCLGLQYQPMTSCSLQGNASRIEEGHHWRRPAWGTCY